MERPLFLKSIRFQLTLGYAVFILIIIILMNIVIFISYSNALNDIYQNGPFLQSQAAWSAYLQTKTSEALTNLRTISIMGTIVVLAVGFVGGYFLATRMLRPIDHVSQLASRISYTNLKERIKHDGPDDEVKRLADTFDDMLERLGSAFDSQKQFIQDASHELRTPLAIAQTNIEVLEMDVNASKEDYQQLVELLKLSLERIAGVSDSLIQLSEGSTQPLHRDKVDLGALLAEVYKETEAKVRDSGINYVLEPVENDLHVRGDAMRLKQAMVNLVDNAEKYNLQSGFIRMKAWRHGKAAMIEISDGGIGIPPEDLPHIFDRFFRVDKSRSRECGGSGLGLTIVKKIVEDHHGKITAASAIGKGSVFCVSLPLGKH